MGNLHERRAECDIEDLQKEQLRTCCLKILRHYQLPEGIINHSIRVAHMAEFIAHRLEASGYPVDTGGVVASALLPMR